MYVATRVSDPHPFNADPDPMIKILSNPDPWLDFLCVSIIKVKRNFLDSSITDLEPGTLKIRIQIRIQNPGNNFFSYLEIVIVIKM